jgi:hypothetical protein
VTENFGIAKQNAGYTGYQIPDTESDHSVIRHPVTGRVLYLRSGHNPSIHPEFASDLECEGDFDLHKEMIQIDSIGLIDTSQATEACNITDRDS